MNQEFLRVRIGDPYNASRNLDKIYFKIGSIHFNWFDIIWNFVNDNRSQIKYITISTDYQAGKPNYTYKHKNIAMNELPIDDFLTLSGNPVFESTTILDVEKQILENRGSLLEAYPSNVHWLVRIVKNQRNNYIKENFVLYDENL